MKRKGEFVEKVALFRKVKQLSEMVETAGKWLSEGWYEKRRVRNEGVNPEEVVEDDAMDWDWEWEKRNEPSVDEQMSNLREKRLRCHCGLRDLEEICFWDVKSRGVALEEWRLVGEDKHENEPSKQEESASCDQSVVGKVK